MKKLTKISRILLLVVAVLTMTQCRKAIEPVYQTPNNNGEKVLFSLTADNGSKGTRTEINQVGEILNITWSEGDVIYVAGSEQGYLGSLTIQSGYGTVSATFSGEITPISKTQTIRVYYLGKTTRTISENTTTINISSQAGTLDDIENYHIASAGIADVAAGTTSLTGVELETKLAIVKFDLTGFGTGTKLYGTSISKNITIDLKSGTLTGDNTATEYSNGIAVSIPESANSTYLALLPGTVTITLSDGTKTDTYDENTISANTFYSNGGNGITPPPPPPVGAVLGLFSVSDTKQVYFSKGNLQYQASTNTWRFAEHQYDYVGDANSNISSSYSGWIDLFGWGTSGQNTGAKAYQPYSTSIENSDYYPGGSCKNDLTYGNKADWGYNAISNGGNDTMQWRTLTGDEWNYLWNTRANASSKVGLASVNDINGLVLLPDNWTQPSSVSFIPDTEGFNTNKYSVSDWMIMENNGAVFLPAAGYRSDTMISAAGDKGFYWSSSHHNIYKDYAFCPYFLSADISTSSGGHRRIGNCVRLVQDL